MTVPTIDHIGIVVQALEPAVLAMKRLLPGAPIRRRSMPEVGLEVAEFAAANVIVELLQYTTQQSGVARQTMGSAPGLNHLSISVTDLDVALTSLAEDGVGPMEGFPRQGAHGRVAFLNVDPRLAARMELCQPDADSSHEEKP